MQSDDTGNVPIPNEPTPPVLPPPFVGNTPQKPKKKWPKILAIAAGAFFMLIVMVAMLDDPDASENATYTPTPTPITETEQPAYALPAAEDFLSFIETRFYEDYEAGLFTIDTIFGGRPVGIEISTFELDRNGRPVISLSAIVRERATGENSGMVITTNLVRIILEWLIDEGFDPYNEWIMPHVFISMPVTGATGQQMWIQFGHSYYNFNTDSIVWNEQ